MGKRIIDLSFKVRGGFSPNGLQKVFLSFCPSDADRMEKIADDILCISNCAIWYHNDSFAACDIDLYDFGMKLQEMKVFVVIVSTKYLENDSMAKNWEYGFAMEHHIPILPIAVESGIEEYFANVMNRIKDGYGDIQILRSEVRDCTEIPYYQKLARDLSSILLENKEVERIKQSFSGRIFLSYRKKDRKYANELMHTIHSISSLRNVSIWFDEFMSTGEKWSDQIANALTQCNVFLLMVSPSIIEPDNYVIREEYPTARKHGKKIISVNKTGNKPEMTDVEELRKIFPGLRVLVDGDNAGELEGALQEISAKAYSTPETDYLVGLAFLNGIDMEHDTERAASLIIASARKNFPEAINKLSEMYWNGDGVAINYENSVFWRKRLVNLYEQRINEIKDNEVLEYFYAIMSLSICLYELNSFRDALYYAKKMTNLIERIVFPIDQLDLNKYLGQAYDLSGKICKRLGLYDDAIAYAVKYHNLTEKRYMDEYSVDNLHDNAVGCERLGDVYYAKGSYEQAEYWYQKALEINREIDDVQNSVESALTLTTSMLRLSDIFIRHGENVKADQICSEAVQLRKRIFEAEKKDENLKQYGEAIISSGTARLLNGKVDEAAKCFAEAKDIFKNLAEKYGTIEAKHAYSIALNREGKIYEERHDYAMARKRYTESLDIRRRIMMKNRSMETVFEYALVLYFIAGVDQRIFDSNSAKVNYEEIVENLLPVLVKDRKGDCYRIFTEAAFERFKIDTFSGKTYLQHAINGWKWLLDQSPSNNEYQKHYDLCRKMYQRCYPC